MRIGVLVLLSWLGAWACVEPPPAARRAALDPALLADILGPGEGRVRTDPDGVTTVLKVGAHSGSRWLSMGTRQMPAGTGLPAHEHDFLEEILYVTEGRGWLLLGEQRIRIESDSTVWVPPGMRHGLENPEGPMRVLWVTAFAADGDGDGAAAGSAAPLH